LDILITEWALDTYLDLKGRGVITRDEYKNKIRPDVMRLKAFPNDPEFSNSKFWSPATGLGGRIPCGFKMKWHQVGPGLCQLRVGVAIYNGEALLCRAYTKDNSSTEMREMAKLKLHISQIMNGLHQTRGKL